MLASCCRVGTAAKANTLECCTEVELMHGAEPPRAAPFDAVYKLDDEVTPEILEMSAFGRSPERAHERAQTIVKEFVVNVFHDGDISDLGLDVEMTSDSTLLINGVRDGPIMKWNLEHEGEEVKEGDVILDINGIRGDCVRLLEALNSCKSLELQVRRPEMLHVTFDAEGDVPLGLLFSYSPGGATLLVQGVAPGLASNWNASQIQLDSGLQIERLDRVFEVNGFRGESRKLCETLSAPGKLDITFIKNIKNKKGKRREAKELTPRRV